jgi:hypothetical protein
MDGILIGPESEQKNVENFNLRTNHISENGFIKNISESNPNSELVFESEFINMKKVNNYFFAERKNIDSFAFVFFASNIDDDRRIGLSYDFQPSINKSIIKAFTSSINNVDVLDVRDLVVEEARKQAGFHIDKSQIEYLGKCLTSSKMSEFCHLFGISIDKTRQAKKETTNNLKIDSGHYWSTIEEIKELEDWKAQIIVYKRYLNKKNQILIKKK